MIALAKVLLGLASLTILIVSGLGVGLLTSKLLIALGCDGSGSRFGDAMGGLLALLLGMVVIGAAWAIGGWAYGLIYAR